MPHLVVFPVNCILRGDRPALRGLAALKFSSQAGHLGFSVLQLQLQQSNGLSVALLEQATEGELQPRASTKVLRLCWNVDRHTQ